MRAKAGALPTTATLVLALGGPPLLALVSRQMLRGSTSIARMLPFDLVLWAILGAVLTVVVSVERQSLSSVGLRQPSASTIGWGLLLLFGINFVLSPATMWIVNKTGLGGFEHGLRQLLAIPVWYRVFLAVSAGVVEETLYRGYAVERLASLTGSYWVGGLVAVVAFGAAHIPVWGPGPALVFLVDGAAATLFYVWKRDLLALVVAHALGDVFGLVVLPR
jgi:uncharacterized protein